MRKIIFFIISFFIMSIAITSYGAIEPWLLYYEFCNYDDVKFAINEYQLYDYDREYGTIQAKMIVSDTAKTSEVFAVLSAKDSDNRVVIQDIKKLTKYNNLTYLNYNYYDLIHYDLVVNFIDSNSLSPVTNPIYIKECLLLEYGGVVSGYKETSIDGLEIKLDENKILIDGETFILSDSLISNFDIDYYLGKRVVFSCLDGTISEINISDKNTMNVILPEQIAEVYDDKVYYYEDFQNEGTLKCLKFDDGMNVVYNGFGVLANDITYDFIRDAFNIETGSVVLCDNDGDLDVDITFIEKYKTYFLESSPIGFEGNYIIEDKNDFEHWMFVNEDDSIVYQVTSVAANPVMASMSNITNKSVVSIAQPINRTSGTTIMVSTATVTGIITSMDEDYEEIEISSKTYTVAPYFRKLLEKDEKTYSFKVGSNVKLYLDYLGRIVSSEISVTSDPYAYLMGYAIEGGKMDGDVSLKLLTDVGKWMVYPLRETVRINGKSFEQSDVPTELEKSAGYINAGKNEKNIENAEAAQLIKFKTATANGKTVISEISTIGESNEGEILLSSYTDCTTPLKYNKSAMSFVDEDGKTVFKVNSSTKIFMVPADRKAGDTAYKKVTYFYFSNECEYFVEAYDIPENASTAKAVVCYRKGVSTASINTIYPGTPSYIITDIITSTYDGIDCHKVTVAELGKNALYNENDEETDRKVLYTEDTSVLSGYKVGDIIRLTYTDDVIDDVQKIFDGEKLLVGDGSHFKQDYDGTKDYLRFMIGTVYINEVEDETGSIDVSPNFAEEGEDGEYTFDPGITVPFNITSKTKFYGYIEERGKVVPVDSSAAELVAAIEYEGNYEEATKVLVIVYNRTVKAVINLDNIIK